MAQKKIALVLGGGGARGLAHIGVLKALVKNGIPIDIIVGTSMGALIGASYALDPDIDALEDHFRRFLMSDKFRSLGGFAFHEKNYYDPEHLLHQISREIKRRIVINLAAHRLSLAKRQRLEAAIEALLDDRSIEETKIPFACAAVDLISGAEIIFKSGSIREAVAASTAIPGFLPPVQMGRYQLIDGSVTVNFPVEAAREIGADIVIVSNVSSLANIEQPVNNVIDIIIRANVAASRKINRLALENADYVITPDIGAVHWTEFKRVDSLLENGFEETVRQVDPIRKLIRQRSRLYYRLAERLFRLIARLLGFNH